MGLVGYILCHMVHWGSPWGCRVHPGSLGLLGCAPEVVEFIRVHWAHQSAQWGRRVHSWCLGSLECPLGGVGFIRGPGFTGMRPGVVGFIRDRWAHSGVACRSTVAGLIRVHTRGRRVHPASLGTFDCAQSVVRFIRGLVN